MKSNGAQVSNMPKPKPLVKGEHDDEVPLLRDVLSALGGTGTIQE
jgi:hypothetical protein